MCTTCCARGTNAKSAIAWAAQPQARMWGQCLHTTVCCIVPSNLVSLCRLSDLHECIARPLQVKVCVPGASGSWDIHGSRGAQPINRDPVYVPLFWPSLAQHGSEWAQFGKLRLWKLNATKCCETTVEK